MIQFAKIVQIEQNTKFSTLFLQTKKDLHPFSRVQVLPFCYFVFCSFLRCALSPLCSGWDKPSGKASLCADRRHLPYALLYLSVLPLPTGEELEVGLLSPSPFGEGWGGAF
jgi:hypothetical protein